MWTHAPCCLAVLRIIASINWAPASWFEYNGILINIIIELIVGRINIVYIVAVGTFLKGCANICLVVMDLSARTGPMAFPLLASSCWARISRLHELHQNKCLYARAAWRRTERCRRAIPIDGVSVDQGGDDAPPAVQGQALRLVFSVQCCVCFCVEWESSEQHPHKMRR